MKLYELTDQYRALQSLADDPELPPDALSDTLEGLEGDIEAKAENLLAVVSNWGSDVSAIDSEIKRLQARKKTLVNRQDSLREYLRRNMDAADISKIKCPLFTITIGKPSEIVLIEDDSKVPDEYCRITRSPNKTAIKNALKDGQTVPGASLGEGARSLRIY